MTLRSELADQLESELRPLMVVDRLEGGFACCGCETPSQVLDRVLDIIYREGK